MAMFIAAIVFDYHMLLCGELENQDELFIAIAYRDTRGTVGVAAGRTVRAL